MKLPTHALWRWLPLTLVACVAFAAATARAAEVIPPKPERYFNDYAHSVKPETAERLNQELEDLEKQSSNQIVVCIYPKMQTNSDIEDYTHKIITTWGLGQKGKDNGAALFVFVQDHKMRIETRPGLEGVLPDATCKDIISDRIAPQLKAGNFDAGMTAGVEAMIQASRNEYKGSGTTAYQRTHGSSADSGSGFGIGTIIFFIIVILIISALSRRRGGGTMYTGAGPIFFGGGWGGGGGGGGSSGGGGGSSSSGGGGFFSSGGGSDFGGGGGASGDW